MKYHCPICDIRIFDASVCAGVVDIKCPRCKNIVSIELSIVVRRLEQYSKYRMVSQLKKSGCRKRK